VDSERKWIVIKDYKDLSVWKAGIDLVTQVYEEVRCFPKDELYGLTDQIRRASVSIPSNIAEGASRNTTKEFVQFLFVALGSASELETQLIIAQRVGYLKDGQRLFDGVTAIRKMLNSLVVSLRKRV
jgi:four helix bundle protein